MIEVIWFSLGSKDLFVYSSVSYQCARASQIKKCFSISKVIMKQNRNIKDLADTFELRLHLAMEEYNTRFEPKIFVVETTRTLEQQKEYVRTWKSTTLKSNHLTGHAVDIAFQWPELYPKSDTPRKNVCKIMRKYGIVNWYYDLKRWFDKPHFQAVEVQAPNKISDTYVVAKNWIPRLQAMIRARSVARHRRADGDRRQKMHERNEIARKILASVSKW